jgi:hypothetical protein
MKLDAVLTYTLTTLLLALPASVSAHHSHANIDQTDVRVFRGVVVKYAWNMPHVYMKVAAANPEGKVVTYSIEMQSPPPMAQFGWTKNSFSKGDHITWKGAHDRNKARYYTDLIWADQPDGTRLFLSSTGEEKAVSPSTDLTGLWDRDDVGGFKPHYKPPEGWPLTVEGQALVDNFHEDQNPMIDCGNPGPPKAMLIPYPIELRRPDADTVVIERELMSEVRTIYLHGNQAAGPPSVLGYSVGRFEGETLVVETSNFLADRWGTHTGIDSSAQKKLLERFSLSEDGMYLHAEITVTDPVYLSEPKTFGHRWRKIPDRTVIQAPCTEESAKLYLHGGR